MKFEVIWPNMSSLEKSTRLRRHRRIIITAAETQVPSQRQHAFACHRLDARRAQRKTVPDAAPPPPPPQQAYFYLFFEGYTSGVRHSVNWKELLGYMKINVFFYYVGGYIPISCYFVTLVWWGKNETFTRSSCLVGEYYHVDSHWVLLAAYPPYQYFLNNSTQTSFECLVIHIRLIFIPRRISAKV